MRMHTEEMIRILETMASESPDSEAGQFASMVAARLFGLKKKFLNLYNKHAAILSEHKANESKLDKINAQAKQLQLFQEQNTSLKKQCRQYKRRLDEIDFAGHDNALMTK